MYTNNYKCDYYIYNYIYNDYYTIDDLFNDYKLYGDIKIIKYYTKKIYNSVINYNKIKEKIVFRQNNIIHYLWFNTIILLY